jgi:hypothetical protein
MGLKPNRSVLVRKNCSEQRGHPQRDIRSCRQDTGSIIAHKLGEAQWEARAKAKSHIMYFNAAFRRLHEAAFRLGVS